MTIAAVPGPVRFARYAYGPNRLGYCGPDAADELLGEAAEGGDLRRIRALATGFEGAWPYLELIAAENDVADPLDPCVVEAYWLGNGLLREVGPRARYDDLDHRFRTRTATREWPWLAAKAGSTSVVHHSFHVLEILPRIGMIRGGLPVDLVGVLERCLVRPGRIVAVTDGALDVDLPPLVLRDGSLQLGEPHRQRITVANGEGFGDVLVPGDDVAVHWDRVCGRLTGAQVRRLLAVTGQNLDIANQTL